MYINQLAPDQIKAINDYLAKHGQCFDEATIAFLDALHQPNGDPLGLLNHDEITLCGRFIEINNAGADYYLVPCYSSSAVGYFESAVLSKDFNILGFQTGRLTALDF